MRNVILVVVVVVGLLGGRAIGQVVNPAAVTFVGAEVVAAEYKQDVCAVFMATYSTNVNEIKDWVALGSGFFTEGTNGLVLAITCDHVVNAASVSKKDLFVGMDTDAGYVKERADIRHRNGTDDVAVLTIRRSGANAAARNRLVSHLAFGGESSIVEGRGVLVIGYPLGRGVEQNRNHPVIRFGMIAQKIEGNSFLLDAVASHGNSGSPVFSLKHDAVSLVGMVTGTAADSISLFAESGQLAASLPYNSGLAAVVKSSVIHEAVEAANRVVTGP